MKLPKVVIIWDKVPQGENSLEATGKKNLKIPVEYFQNRVGKFPVITPLLIIPKFNGPSNKFWKVYLCEITGSHVAII